MNTNIQTNESDMTKKERREVRRQEARHDQAKAARGRGLRRILTWGIVVAVLVGIGWLVWRAAQNAPTGPQGGGQELAVPVSAEDNAKGPADAPITLVEYGDYQCPACAAFHPVVEGIFNEAEGQIRLVYRHYPLKNIHPNAEMAARAVQAAGLQGAYWELHDIVYERQTEWASIPRTSARNKILEYARELGLDAEQLDQAIDSDAVKNKVDADIDSGDAAGVNSTPSFFVNGVRIAGANSFEEFRLQILGDLAPEVLGAQEPSMNAHDESEGTEGTNQ